MGDYVLKMCRFIPWYFRMLICNIPAKKIKSQWLDQSNCPSLNTFKLLPQTKQQEKKKAQLFARSELKITFKLKISTLSKAIILYSSTSLKDSERITQRSESSLVESLIWTPSYLTTKLKTWNRQLGAWTWGEKEVPMEPSITAEIPIRGRDSGAQPLPSAEFVLQTTSILQILQEWQNLFTTEKRNSHRSWDSKRKMPIHDLLQPAYVLAFQLCITCG